MQRRGPRLAPPFSESTNMHSESPMSLSIDQNEEDDSSSSASPLDERILQVIQQCAPEYKIRPARLASEVGLSVNDACAELCALLSIVGGGETGATFEFIKVDGVNVMEFTFPPDFARRARNKRRSETLRDAFMGILYVLVKALKVLTAFGLILSLLIVTILGMVGLLAAIVAMSRGGHRNQTSDLMRRLRSLFFSMRQLLWCYAMFGGTMEGQDPFLREMAYDLALCSSVCCGSPGSLWFWLRASQLRSRQRGWTRRYGRLGSNIGDEQGDGVSLLNRGTWGRDDEDTSQLSNTSGQEDYRGLLSVAVEFLFGPTPFTPGPSEHDIWKLRAAVIVQLSSKEGVTGVSLEELAPYADVPPKSLNRGIVASTLNIIAHFNGVPVSSPPTNVTQSVGKNRFLFPELLAESHIVGRHENVLDLDDDTWESVLYAKETVTVRSSSFELPSSLQKQRYMLTKLQRRQFLHCVILGVLNFVGVLWVGQSLQPGGVLDISSMAGSVLASALQNGLIPVLHFYSILFFGIPTGRLLLILALNAHRERRNRKRADLAYEMTQQESSTQDSN